MTQSLMFENEILPRDISEIIDLRFEIKFNKALNDRMTKRTTSVRDTQKCSKEIGCLLND